MARYEDLSVTKLRLGSSALIQNQGAETVTGAQTLTKADNGKTFIMDAAGGATITLPAPLDGLKFKFIVGSTFTTTDWIVATNGGTTTIQGLIMVNGAVVVGADEKQINFVATAETVGDWASVESDGTNWYLEGVGNLAGAITLTAP